MSTNITFNGSSYTIPATGDDSWGTNVSNYLIAISTGSLQKTGGTFTLTAEANFGATYGLKVPYIKSQATNPASAGIIRLGNAESIKWRNQANSADVDLTVNSSNVLQFNSNTLLDSSGTGLTGLITNAMVSASAAIAYSKLNLSNSILNADINASAAIAYSKLNLATSIVNADISASAAIAYSKLNLATSIVNADINASAAIVYSKLSLSDSIVNADINSAAAIAYSKLNLSTSIVNADINASAAIAYSKLAALTASRALVSDGSGFVSASSTTSTEIGYVSGVTSAIQTQLDGKINKSLVTTKGDIIVATGNATPVRVGVGADNTFLKADSSQASGVVWASPSGAALAVTSKSTTYTATTSDDVILVTTGSSWTLTLYAASGNSGKTLRVKKTSNDVNVLTIDGNASETIDDTTTTTINTQFEEITLVCDGSNWYIMERYIPSMWTTFTPTGTLTTNVTYYGWWKRDGDSMMIQGTISFSGANTQGVCDITIPLGLSMDTSNFTAVGVTRQSFGVARLYDSSADQGYDANVVYDSSTKIRFSRGDTTPGSIMDTSSNRPITYASGDTISWQCTVPISGWSG